MGVVRYPLALGEIVDCESAQNDVSVSYGDSDTPNVLLLQLAQLGSHLLQVRMLFPLRVCQRFLNHQELIKFMGDVKVGLLHLEQIHDDQ